MLRFIILVPLLVIVSWYNVQCLDTKFYYLHIDLKTKNIMKRLYSEAVDIPSCFSKNTNVCIVLDIKHHSLKLLWCTMYERTITRNESKEIQNGKRYKSITKWSPTINSITTTVTTSMTVYVSTMSKSVTPSVPIGETTTVESKQKCMCTKQNRKTLYLSVWSGSQTTLCRFLPKRRRFAFTGRKFPDQLYLIAVDISECRLYGQGSSGKSFYLISACIDKGQSERIMESENEDLLFLGTDSIRKLIVISVNMFGKKEHATIRALHPNGTFTKLRTDVGRTSRNHWALSVTDHLVYYVIGDESLGFVDYLQGTKTSNLLSVGYSYGIACGMVPGTVYFLFKESKNFLNIGSYKFIDNKLTEMPRFGQHISYQSRGYPEYARVLSWKKQETIFVLITKKKASSVASSVPKSKITNYLGIPRGSQYCIGFV